jgi:hypothetical protein
MLTSTRFSKKGHRRVGLVLGMVLGIVGIMTGGSGTALASASSSPAWMLESFSSPTHLSQNETTECLEHSGSPEVFCDSYKVTARNAGSEPTSAPVTLTDSLPAGITVKEVQFFSGSTNDLENHAQEDCADGSHAAPSETVTCTFSGVVAPDEMLRILVYFTVDNGVSGSLTSQYGVSGGGALNATGEETSPVSAIPAPFGISSFNFYKDGLNGEQESQAGGHPYELITTINLNNEFRSIDDFLQPEFTSDEDLKDVVVNLPLGFVGSTLAAPECTLAELSSENLCPPDTIVGHLFTEPENGVTNVDGPLYNLVPERGAPAEFGYVDSLHGAHVLYTHVVPTAGGYVLQTTAKELPQVNLSRIVVTFYGDPAARDDTTNPQVPFFTNPTACGNGPQVANVYIDSWQHPARFNGDGEPADLSEAAWAKATSESPAVTGCNALRFKPELGAQPTTHEADKPSGLEFEMKIPQSETVGTLATPALKDAVVKFPAGMTVDPSSADGLGVCSLSQIGWTGPTLFDFTVAPPQCPEASKIGSLELTTPLIPGTLTGEIFLAAQNENPFHSTLATYVVINDPVTGVVLKIAGELKADPQTGQLTAVFAENPQLPFSDLKLHFFGGPRAELATPESCGTYTTNSELTPWSAPDSGPIGTPFDNYMIDEDCASDFVPAFTGGSTNLQAGADTAFVASFSREDSDQELGGLTVSLPAGLLADVASVPLCPEAQANAGTCPESSQVGTVEAGAGPGPNPLFISGKVYLTGPYNGGPYGLSVVVPADPGPFNFGVVVVRQSLRIDPHDAHVTDVSNSFPTMLAVPAPNGGTTGIPIRLRRVDVKIDRPGFAFNPTNCTKSQVGANIVSTQELSSSLAVPFQVTNCATLKFAPKFSVSTSGKTSKARGASLTAKVSYPSAQQGTYADITKVKVELPKALPSRLTTLQKACTTAQFNADPAKCSSESMIGYATVRTPILAQPLHGPAIFVSHGGEAFPSLTIVLQGDGVTIDLVGTTFISKAGITSTTFKTVPDTPFSTFELTLPEGPYSALAANGNLCTEKLTMPNEFIGQNGAEVHEITPMSVLGCPKVKTQTRAKKLNQALKACKKDKSKAKRGKCEKAARRKYGSVEVKKKHK